jgi:predicted TIM-barrel fold metal-dependent hydrolase
MTLADSHLHFFKHGYRGLYGRSLLRPDVEVYEELRAIHDIERALVVGYQGEGIDPDNNAYVRGLAAGRPWMETLAHIDARAAPTSQGVSRLLSDGHIGIALYIQDSQAARALSSWPVGAWRALNERLAIISLNVTLDFVPMVASIARDNPDCSFLVSHIGMPGSYKTPPAQAEAANRLAPLLRSAAVQNIFVKISGLYAISDPAFDYPHRAAQPFVQIALQRFGSQRCLWGSDFAPALDHVSFAQTIANPWLDDLDKDERASVMGGNLLGLLAQERA